MKRFLWAVSMALILIPSMVFGQESIVRLTRFTGDRITGVSASSAFDVYLEQSSETKVVVEISQELENRLDLTLGPDGIVRVSLKPGNKRSSRKTIMKMTVYLPELSVLRGSGATTFYASGNFTAQKAEISLSGASDLKSLNLDAQQLEMNCSGASDASLNGNIRELNARFSGASDGKLNLTCEKAKFKTEGASDLSIKGKAAYCTMAASGGSDISAFGFTVDYLDVSVSGASDAKVWAEKSLEAQASSASSIRYKGNPGTYNAKSSSAGSVKKMN